MLQNSYFLVWLVVSRNVVILYSKHSAGLGLSSVSSQVGFAEFNNTADNRANIGGTIIGTPIVGQ